MNLPLLTLTNVRKSYGTFPVLQDITMSLDRSKIACLIGPSGSGKSTLLRCVNALAPINSGSIKLDGIEVNDPRLDAVALRRRVGMVFQSYNLFPHRTVLQNVMMAPIQILRRDPDQVRQEALALLHRVKMSGKDNSYPGELSGGQQQRVAIARSLAMRPTLMMFDEVTAALDPEMVKEVLLTIRDVAADGMACLIVTHEMRFAQEIADEVYFTDRGVIVEHGPARQIFANPSDERTRAFLSRVL